MIALTTPVTITPPPVNGKVIPSFTLTNIDYSVYYDDSQQTAVAIIKPMGAKIVLWNASSTPAYSSAGNFTDSDTDARLSDLLNVSQGVAAIQSAILSLYPHPSAPKKAVPNPVVASVSTTTNPPVATPVATPSPAPVATPAPSSTPAS
jgi:hypothetical protein